MGKHAKGSRKNRGSKNPVRGSEKQGGSKKQRTPRSNSPWWCWGDVELIVNRVNRRSRALPLQSKTSAYRHPFWLVGFNSLKNVFESMRIIIPSSHINGPKIPVKFKPPTSFSPNGPCDFQVSWSHTPYLLSFWLMPKPTSSASCTAKFLRPGQLRPRGKKNLDFQVWQVPIIVDRSINLGLSIFLSIWPTHTPSKGHWKPHKYLQGSWFPRRLPNHHLRSGTKAPLHAGPNPTRRLCCHHLPRKHPEKTIYTCQTKILANREKSVSDLLRRNRFRQVVEPQIECEKLFIVILSFTRRSYTLLQLPWMIDYTLRLLAKL